MAAESTYIARASHDDSRSLRIIQILTMVFLPASLVATIFGMGFFNTSSTDNGAVQFSVSGHWWIYLAVSVPLTLVILLFMSGYTVYQRRPDRLLGFVRRLFRKRRKERVED